MDASDESERIEMSRRERDRLKVLHGVCQGEGSQKEAARSPGAPPTVRRSGRTPAEPILRTARPRQLIVRKPESGGPDISVGRHRQRCLCHRTRTIWRSIVTQKCRRGERHATPTPPGPQAHPVDRRHMPSPLGVYPRGPGQSPAPGPT